MPAGCRESVRMPRRMPRRDNATTPAQPGRLSRPAASATDVTTSTTARLASSAPSANRGMVLRKSFCDDRSAADRTVPVRKPRPNGEYGTKPTPSSAAVGTTLLSTSRLQIDHSLCTAAIGCTSDGGAQLLGGHLRQPQVAHLARGHQLGHCPRRFPRWAPTGRGDACNRGRRHRSSTAPGFSSMDWRTYAASPWTSRSPAARLAGSLAMPNFVASVTSSRRSASNPEMSRSLFPPPYHVGGVDQRHAEVKRNGARWPVIRCRPPRRTPVSKPSPETDCTHR